MKRLVLVAVSAILVAAIVATSGGAEPGQNPNGPKRDGDHGHWFRRACDVQPAHVAACDAQVVTDSAGKPLATSSTPSGYGPDAFHGAYTLPTTAPGTPTIAIVDAYDDPNIEADLAVYSTQYGLPQCTTSNGCFRKVNQTGGTSYPTANAGWSLEIALDVETAHQICQNCKILLVEASSNSMTNLGIAENEAVALGANVVSNSWGGSEFSGETTLDGYFNHPGVVVTASSGDNGYGVEYPAASRYVTAVGGTTLNLGADNSWGSETAWAGAGSGCSAYESKPSWQTDSGCSRRTVADVSADADPNTGAAVYDSVTYQGQSGWFQVGGTSLAAPLIASVYALTGSAASATYGSTPYSHTSSLHDVTSGSNGSCGSSYLCTAKSGYDGPTGLGTPNGLVAFGSSTAAQSDFSLTASPPSQTVTAGGTGTSYSVSTSAIGSFAGTVSLSVSGLPTGATATFSPGSLTGSDTSTLTVTTTSTTPAASYPLTISGTSGGTTHTASVTLVVQAPAQTGNFDISVNPSTAPIGTNSTTTYTVTVSPQNGFTGAVTLSASSSSSGLSGKFSPNPTSSTSTLTVRAHKLARGQTYTITITGKSGSLTHSTTLTLTT